MARPASGVTTTRDAGSTTLSSLSTRATPGSTSSGSRHVRNRPLRDLSGVEFGEMREDLDDRLRLSRRLDGLVEPAEVEWPGDEGSETSSLDQWPGRPCETMIRSAGLSTLTLTNRWATHRITLYRTLSGATVTRSRQRRRWDSAVSGGTGSAEMLLATRGPPRRPRDRARGLESHGDLTSGSLQWTGGSTAQRRRVESADDRSHRGLRGHRELRPHDVSRLVVRPANDAPLVEHGGLSEDAR